MKDQTARTAACFALIRRLDEETDDDEWLELFERARALADRLPLMEGYGIVDAEGGVLLVCTTEEQARRIQMTLLMGGVVTCVNDRAFYPLLDFCHPESAPDAVTARLLAAIKEENSGKDCDCVECAQALADEDDACDCDGAGCDECRGYDASLDAVLESDECGCPCARCKADDHDACTGPLSALKTFPSGASPKGSKKYLN